MATCCFSQLLFLGPFVLCLLFISDVAAVSGEFQTKDDLPAKYVKDLARKFLRASLHLESHHLTEHGRALGEAAAAATVSIHAAEPHKDVASGSQSSCSAESKDDLCRRLQQASAKQTQNGQSLEDGSSNKKKIINNNNPVDEADDHKIHGQSKHRSTTQSFADRYKMHSHQEDPTELSGMDYSPARKRPPIHN